MTLDECLEKHRSAMRPNWKNKKCIIVMSRMMLLFGTDSTSGKAPEWNPSEDLQATDYRKPKVELHELRGWRMLGQFLSTAEVEYERSKYESQRPMREKMYELGRLMHERISGKCP